MVDIVSKNGNFLLNVGPRKDGTFDEKTIGLLDAIGDWLAVNGEAIYNTVPFTVYGEGPTRQDTENGIGYPEQLIPFTAEDVRFTQKDGALYAILLGWPGSGRAVLKTLRTGGELEKPVTRVTLLGDGAPLKFEQDGAGLAVELSGQQPCKEAFTLKIESL